MTTETENQGFWRRRTALEKKLTLLNIIAVIVVLALIISLVTVIKNTNTNEDNLKINFAERLTDANQKSKNTTIVTKEVKDYTDVCFSPGCIHISSEILAAMDTEVEPCDDFYTFTCGNFLKTKIIPDEKVTVNTFSIIEDHLLDQLRVIISEESNEHEAKPFKIAKDFFKACMNKSLIEERGIEPILSIVKKLGDWPLLVGSNWDESSWTWDKVIIDNRKLGLSMDNILNFGVGPDVKNSSIHIIYLDECSPGISREYIIKGLDDKIVQAYYSYMVDVAVIYGAKRDVAEKDLKETLEFEYALANISAPQEDRRDATILYNPMTVGEIQKKYPYVNWIEYMNGLLPSEITVNENEVVIVRAPKYFEGLGELLARTPKRTLANYLMWRVIKYISYFSIDTLRKRGLEYEKIVNGKEEQEARWKECIDLTSASLHISVGALYVRKHFKETAKRETIEMVNGIKEEFRNILENVKWMDDKTKAIAQNKLKTITNHIGYPDELMDNNKIEDYYKNLDIHPDKYLEAALNINTFGFDDEFKKLRQPVNKTYWVDHGRPAVVNAYYSATENSIAFPAGILQGKFFSPDRPRYMNYGAIGTVVGHEITHGFDDQGKQYDENGLLVDWWEHNTTEAYLIKAKCIIDQYSNYTETNTGLNLNGINTQGENIADNGGLKESYNAYKKWVEVNGPEPKLPGLDYTPEQMFWISFANSWCALSRRETIRNLIETNEHSPEKFRVLGSITNKVEFSRDFNCPEGSPMNPIDKCEVW